MRCGKRIEEGPADQPHEARQADEVDLVLHEHVGDGAVV